MELSLDRLQEQVPAPAHAPSEDHSFGIEDRRDGGDAEGEATGLRLDNSGRHRVPSTRGREDPFRGCRPVHPELPGQPDDAVGGYRFLERASTPVDVVPGTRTDRQVPDLAGGAA